MTKDKYLKIFLIPVTLLFLWTTTALASTIDFETLPLSYVGTATTISNGIRLTDNTDPDMAGPAPAGAVWSLDPVSVASGFSTTFWFRMSGGTGMPDYSDLNDQSPGADGFAFVIQNDPIGNQALGIGAGGMGYYYITNSLAVEFDTWRNVANEEKPGYGDEDGNHVAVNTRGTSFNVPHHTYAALEEDFQYLYPDDYEQRLSDYTGDPALEQYYVDDRPLNDGLEQQAQIDYVPGSLSVYLNSTLLFTTSLDLDELLSLSDNGTAYVGFTSGTRYGYQNHDILFQHAPEPATWITLLSGLALAFTLSRTRRKYRG